jgi:hypothetical protein
MSQPWKEIAWNGVCFKVPVLWEIGRIGLRYLLLENEDGPQLEMKWSPVKGRFSMEKQLKQLQGVQDRRIRKAFQAASLPEKWHKFLQPFRAAGFIWQGASLAGRGVLLYCPECRTATLIQFYRRDHAPIETTAAILLESFKDHGHQKLKVFDISAELPRGFSLKTYRFEAGEYEISLSDDCHTTTLYRWSPAAVLLRRQPLPEFVGFRLDLNGFELINVDETTVEGSARAAPSVGRRILNRIRKIPDFRRIRIWHENEKNRLLGVAMQGRRPVDAAIFTKICESYETS